ncbi:DUF4349 domain-containing protein [Streptomyces fumanus]|uniref:DUF4349 domain-containing protein n=1 Tax=Streptomyces fumanus TaxID=67302 RepID=UPI0033F5197C
MQVRRSARSARPVSALAGLLLAAALALTGCSAAGDSGADGADKAAGARADSQAGSGAGYEGGKGRAADDGKASAPPKLTPDHVIHTASLTVEVENVPKALARARAATESAGGYVGEESTARDEEGAEYTEVVLRVPVGAYDKVLAGLEGTGRLVERDAEARDVTDQVVDVDSRVKTQRASVARIRELMDRATKLSDVVTLEGELSNRQAELESLLARQASLKDRTDLATITLSLSERPAGRDDGSDDPGFTDALAGGWDAFVTVLRWVVVAAGAVLPFAAALLLLVVVWLRVVRPRLPRRPAPAPTATALGPLPSARPAGGSGGGAGTEES